MPDNIAGNGVDYFASVLINNSYANRLGQSLRTLETEIANDQLIKILDTILSEIDDDQILALLLVLWEECPEIAIESGCLV